MKTNIYFVRHAHSTYTPDELNRPLSERGFLDAKVVTETLKSVNIDVVISSPYKRAIQTVEGIAQHFDQTIMMEEDYKERLLSKVPVDDFNNAIKKVWEDEHFSWEGGESNYIAQERGVSVTKKVLDIYHGKNIVVGTHGNIMVLIMKYFDSKYDYHFWKELDMPDIYKLTFEGEKLIYVNHLWRRKTI
ncbi:histidine phosphatase family protein [Chengkuizengella axinellae]|uniref:Histidine phosphatase family protein n=1 Tax=Chengkuizengella axinellae TaxID=3064388 RepID=A0ABT9IYS1_9BACL|nr:histidine phosphatase family protein [Chengkuizengella sp. 2205SS18-9]MDP5274292.1 histidine phosphatase family protein [Chengkuizengella sp. 2205SS18-9]